MWQSEMQPNTGMWGNSFKFIGSLTVTDFIQITVIFLAICLVIIPIMDWISHIIITKKAPVQFGYGKFSQFKREFEKIDWNYSEETPQAFSGIQGKNCCMSSIDVKKTLYIFNGYAMCMKTPIDLLCVKYYINKHIQDNLHPESETKKATYDWSKSEK